MSERVSAGMSKGRNEQGRNHMSEQVKVGRRETGGKRS